MSRLVEWANLIVEHDKASVEFTNCTTAFTKAMNTVRDAALSASASDKDIEEVQLQAVAALEASFDANMKCRQLALKIKNFGSIA